MFHIRDEDLKLLNELIAKTSNVHSKLTRFIYWEHEDIASARELICSIVEVEDILQIIKATAMLALPDGDSLKDLDQQKEP